MSRIGAQRVVNNFSGGLVTEANQLTFPENSLSKAINVELGVDGSVEVRGAFSKLLRTHTLPDTSTPDYPWLKTLVKIRVFNWEERGSVLVAFIYEGADYIFGGSP